MKFELEYFRVELSPYLPLCPGYECIYMYVCMNMYAYTHAYIYIYIYKLSSQYPRTVCVDYSLHRIYEGNHINL